MGEHPKQVARGNVALKEITCRKKLSRDVSEYKSNSAHVTVAKQIMDAGKVVRKGDFIQYIIAEGNGAKYKRAVHSIQVSSLGLHAFLHIGFKMIILYIYIHSKRFTPYTPYGGYVFLREIRPAWGRRGSDRAETLEKLRHEAQDHC